ncbi:MAG: hypothetical protein WD356_04800 [Pseudomonadales bacterium]
MTGSTDKRLSARVKLLLILATAVGPIILAYIFYFYFSDFAPAEGTNEGHLILPPRHVEEIAAEPGKEIPRGQWAMLMLTGPECDQDCERLMYLSRQVHRGLGKDAERVERYLLVGGNNLSASFRRLIEADYPDIQVRYYLRTSLNGVFEKVVEAPMDGDYIFLMDPNGNIMMYYTSDLAGKPMLSDLKHLLKISTIG